MVFKLYPRTSCSDFILRQYHILIMNLTSSSQPNQKKELKTKKIDDKVQ